MNAVCRLWLYKISRSRLYGFALFGTFSKEWSNECYFTPRLSFLFTHLGTESFRMVEEIRGNNKFRNGGGNNAHTKTSLASQLKQFLTPCICQGGPRTLRQASHCDKKNPPPLTSTSECILHNISCGSTYVSLKQNA